MICLSVALDAGALYEWKRAAGCIYAEELRLLRLSAPMSSVFRIATAPEMKLNFTEQLRKFSKRTVAIEEKLAEWAIDHADRAAAMRADERASIDTRPRGAEETRSSLN